MRKEEALQLNGRRIIVTGGAQGIGAGAVRAFAAEEGHVASLDIDDELGKKVAAEASQRGPGAVRYYHCDISSRAEVEDTFKSAVGHLGGLDALVNIAGVDTFAPAENITDQDWDLTLKVNARGTMYTNQAAFKYMRDHGGRIINFASSAGMNGSQGSAHYAASKGAVLAWTRTVAREWGKYGITVNAIAPAVWTRLFDAKRASMTPEQRKALDERLAFDVPIGGRLGDSDRDVAPVLVFLVGDGAHFVTGQTIPVDGGLAAVR